MFSQSRFYQKVLSAQKYSLNIYQRADSAQNVLLGVYHETNFAQNKTAQAEGSPLIGLLLVG